IELRRTRPDARLADAQLAVAREYGFSSWRKLKAEVDRMAASTGRPASEDAVAAFLRDVGTGQIDKVRAAIAAAAEIVNAVGPHPFWGGRPQALHVAIEAGRREIFDLLLDSGADPNGS